MLTANDPTRQDLVFLSRNLRDSDALEMDSHRHKRESRENQMWRCADISRGCIVVRDDTVPICVYGIADGEDAATGVPWMLGTDGLLKHSKKVARWGYDIVEAMQEDYVLLKNIVHINNSVSQRWLEWMKFTIVRDREFMVGGEPFYLFYRVADKETNHV